jgi:hypothetical protein
LANGIMPTPATMTVWFMVTPVEEDGTAKRG